MSLRGRTSSAFYTHRARTSTMLVKKSVKMHSVACQLSVKQILDASFWYFFFCISIMHPKKNYSKIHYILMRFTNNNEQWSPFLKEVKYAVFRDLSLYIFHFPLCIHILGYTWKYYQQFSSGLRICLSQIYSHYYHVLFVPTSANIWQYACHVLKVNWSWFFF